MIPDAVLSAFVQAKGCREATRAIAGVQEQLEDCKAAADEATKAVNRFGRVRGIAVLDVDAAKARAKTAAAARDLDGFDGRRAEATATVDASEAQRTVAAAVAQIDEFARSNAEAALGADASQVHRETLQATREVEAFGGTRSVATLDADASGLAQVNGQIRRSSREVEGLADSFQVLRVSKREVDDLIDVNVDTFGGLSDAVNTTGSSVSGAAGAFSLLPQPLSAIGAAGFALVPVLLAIIGPVGALVAALSPLSGLAVGAGAGLVALAQGLGVAVLASMGVADALKEQTTGYAQAAQQAISSAAQQRSAARAVQAAQDGVRQATDGVRTASRAVEDAAVDQGRAIAALAPAYAAARRAMADMREAAVDAALGLRSARFAAQDARRALADLLAGPSPRALADAHRDITDALRGEADAARDLADAQRDLNDLMQPASALDLADAQDAVSDAARAQQRAQAALEAQLKATGAEMASQAISAADWVAAAEAGIEIPGVTFGSGADPAAAALALADAQNAVGDAARDAARAQERLAALEAGPTQDQIAEARRRVEDAERAVADARRDTADAQRALRDLETPASADAIARARHEVALAENAVRDAMREAGRAISDRNVAEARGLSRAPQVVAAHDAVRDAARRVEDADRALVDAHRAAARAAQNLSDAQIAQGEAAQGAALGAAALDEKMSKLPPSAQAFVRALVAMKPRLDELRETAAAGFFPGATDGLRAAMGSFGQINRVVAETSAVLGDAARSSGELVGSPAFGKDLYTIGNRNAHVIDTLGQALRHVISAVRHVLVAAGPLTQWLADVAIKWALNAAEAAKAGRESGKLADFFERSRAVAERLGSILGHLAGGLFGIGKAGTDSGNDILRSIDKTAKRFDAWANSVGGQAAISEFFKETQALAAALVPVVGDVVSAFALLALKLLPLTTTLEILGPLADEATVAFVLLKLAATGVAVATGVWSAVTAVSTALMSTWTIAIIRATAASARAAIATRVMAIASGLLSAAMSANPIMLVVVAIAALVAGLIYAYKHSETFRRIVDGALRAVGKAVDWLVDRWHDFTGLFSDGILTGIGRGLAGLVDILLWPFKAAWDAILDFFGVHSPSRLFAELGGWMVEGLVNGIKALGALLASVATWLKDQIIGGVKAYVGLYVGLGSWLIHRVIDGVKALAGAIADAAGWLKNRIVDGIKFYVEGYKAVGSWVLNRIVDGVKVVGEALASVGGWLKNRVTEAVHAAAEGFRALGGWVLNRVVDGIRVVTDALSNVGGWLKNRLIESFETVKDAFKSIGGAIMGWIVDGLKGGANLLVTFLNKLIDVINKIPGVDIDHVKGFAEGGKYQGGPNGNGTLAAQGFAHGGAFARTGGLVGAPITLMGEEAPRHPEFVIPTNPAYRGRAQMLAMQAAQAVGLVRGGMWSQAEMADLWRRQGGGDAAIAGAVGMAESGGNQNAANGPYHGLWQVGPNGPFDPVANARAGIAKWRAGGNDIDRRWRPWEAYTGPDGVGNDGPWRQFAEAASAVGGGGDGGGILGQIAGAVGDLIAKGAGALIGQLPGVDSLPDWIKGTGTYALGKVGDWIKDKFSDLTGGGGGGYSPGTLPAGSSQHDAFMAMQRAGNAISGHNFPYVYGGGHNPSFSGPYDCSGLVSAILHAGGLLDSPMSTDGLKVFGEAGDGKAITIGVRGSTGRQAHTMMKIGSRYIESGSGHGAKWVNGWSGNFPIHRHPPGLAEGGIYMDAMGRIADPEQLGWGLRQGGAFGGVPFGGWFGAGGTVPGPMGAPVMIGAHGGERVTPAGRGDDITVHVTFDGLPVELQKLVKVEIKRNGDELAAEWGAGVR